MASKIKEDEFNVKLIQLIELRPCLYDYKRLDYANRNVQDAAWLEISKITNESVADCKERWKNLRGCYTRHLKKMKRPSSSFGRYVKPYYLAAQLKFLDKFTKTRPPRSIFKPEELEIGIDQVDQETPNETDDDTDYSREVETPPSPTDKIEGSNEDTKQFSRPNEIKKSKKVTLSEVNACALDFFKSRQENSKYNRNPDPDLAFLYSLLPDVKDMNSEQKRRFKMGVLQLVGEIIEEN